MSTYYDNYDYPAYWEGRDYEHKSEIIALKSLLEKVPKIHTVVDVGAGYGRLTPYYGYRAKNIILSDPSSKLLSLARKALKNKKNISFIPCCLKTVVKKVKGKKINLVIMIRVLHHLDNLDKAFAQINKTLRPNGFLILEFANKSHFKATISQMFKGNLTFPIDIFPSDLRSKKSKKDKCIPFSNYHPEEINKKLTDNGFEIIEKRSVSNIRSTLLKSIIPIDILLYLEDKLQILLSRYNFGPSIFLLAQKMG
ncbi:class I SAM-dependent methyltransferase [Patescibacteria group bacterium]